MDSADLDDFRSSDLPGAREVITDGETSFFIRKGDIEDMSEKLLLAADPRALEMQRQTKLDSGIV